MQYEWRREQESLKNLRALRVATRDKLKEHRNDLSRLNRDLADVRSQLDQAMVGLGQSYELLGRINELSSTARIGSDDNGSRQ